MIVQANPDGTYSVIAQDGTGRILHTTPTNAAAWRWIDRQQGEAISKSEQRGDWIAYRALVGESR